LGFLYQELAKTELLLVGTWTAWAQRERWKTSCLLRKVPK